MDKVSVLLFQILPVMQGDDSICQYLTATLNDFFAGCESGSFDILSEIYQIAYIACLAYDVVFVFVQTTCGHLLFTCMGKHN